MSEQIKFYNNNKIGSVIVPLKSLDPDIVARRKLFRFQNNYEVLFNIISFTNIIEYFRRFQLVSKSFHSMQKKMVGFWRKVYGLYFRQTTTYERRDVIWERRFRSRHSLTRIFGVAAIRKYFDKVHKPMDNFEKFHQDERFGASHLTYWTVQAEKNAPTLYNLMEWQAAKQRCVIQILQQKDEFCKWFLQPDTFFVKRFDSWKGKEDHKFDLGLALIGPNLEEVKLTVSLEITLEDEYYEEDYQYTIDFNMKSVLNARHSNRKKRTNCQRIATWEMMSALGFDIHYIAFLMFLTELIMASGVKKSEKTAKMIYPKIYKIIMLELKKLNI